MTEIKDASLYATRIYETKALFKFEDTSDSTTFSNLAISEPYKDDLFDFKEVENYLLLCFEEKPEYME